MVGVPGYPVSAYISLDLFVKPLVFQKMGVVPPEPYMIEATVSRKLFSNLGMEEFIRVKLGKVGEKIIATPISRGAGVKYGFWRLTILQSCSSSDPAFPD